MKKVFLLILPFLASCSLFSKSEAGDAVTGAVIEMKKEHDQMLAAFEAIATRSIGADDVKLKILTEIANSRITFNGLVDKTVTLIEKEMKVDYKALFQQVKGWYEELRKPTVDVRTK